MCLRWSPRRPRPRGLSWWPRSAACRAGCMATACAWARCCSTLPTMRSSSPSVAACACAAACCPSRAMVVCGCASRCATPASVSASISRPACSMPSSRPTYRPPGCMAAPAWAWPSAGGWPICWAAGSASAASRARAAPSGSKRPSSPPRTAPPPMPCPCPRAAGCWCWTTWKKPARPWPTCCKACPPGWTGPVRGPWRWRWWPRPMRRATLTWWCSPTGSCPGSMARRPASACSNCRCPSEVKDDGIFAAFIPKPVLPALLADTLSTTLAQGRNRAPHQPRPAQALPRFAPGHRLLLAEDNAMNQEVALELLKDLGFAVDLACDGQQALDQARRQAYELVLMDVQMPVMDGLEATRQIRQLPGWARTPILAMTANAFAEDRAVALAAGMDDHIPKPVDPTLLAQTLAKWLPQALLAEGEGDADTAPDTAPGSTPGSFRAPPRAPQPATPESDLR